MPVTPPSGATPLTRDQVFNVVEKLVPKLSQSVGQLTQLMLRLMEADGTVALTTIRESLFPVTTETSASTQLSKLLWALENAAAENNLLLMAHYIDSGAKRAGVADRCLYFVSPGSRLIAEMEALNAFPPGHLVLEQSGRSVDAEL